MATIDLTWREKAAISSVLDSVMDENVVEWDEERECWSVGDRVVLSLDKGEYAALKSAIKKL